MFACICDLITYSRLFDCLVSNSCMWDAWIPAMRCQTICKPQYWSSMTDWCDLYDHAECCHKQWQLPQL